MHSFVMIKPDAFELTIPSEVARQLFRDFSYFLIHRGVNPENAINHKCSEEAVRQIQERSVSEMSFRGELRKPEVTAYSLLSYAEEYFHKGGTEIADVLQAGLRCLSGGVYYAKRMTLSPENVENIYFGSNEVIMSKLHEYLDGHEVIIVDLGDIEMFILQWWKTFSRHYFLDYSMEKYPLRNLIHVAEEDNVYLKKLMEER